MRALGEATFLATASGVRVEAEKLYSASAVWANIIPNLSAARVQREIEAREFIETFERDVGTIPDLSDMSLYSLSPYAHVKIYRLRESFDINTAPNFGFDRQQIFGRVSEDTNSSIYVTRMRSPVAWSTDDELIDVEYDLFIFYFDPQSLLLFICASSRGDGLYRRIARDLVGYDPKILGLSELNRALKELARCRHAAPCAIIYPASDEKKNCSHTSSIGTTVLPLNCAINRKRVGALRMSSDDMSSKSHMNRS